MQKNPLKVSGSLFFWRLCSVEIEKSFVANYFSETVWLFLSLEKKENLPRLFLSLKKGKSTLRNAYRAPFPIVALALLRGSFRSESGQLFARNLPKQTACSGLQQHGRRKGMFASCKCKLCSARSDRVLESTCLNNVRVFSHFKSHFQSFQECFSYCDVFTCPTTSCRLSLFMEDEFCEKAGLEDCPYGQFGNYTTQNGGAFFCAEDVCMFQKELCDNQLDMEVAPEDLVVRPRKAPSVIDLNDSNNIAKVRPSKKYKFNSFCKMCFFVHAAGDCGGKHFRQGRGRETRCGDLERQDERWHSHDAILDRQAGHEANRGLPRSLKTIKFGFNCIFIVYRSLTRSRDYKDTLTRQRTTESACPARLPMLPSLPLRLNQMWHRSKRGKTR